MLEMWDKFCNAVFDAALGWLLGLSWTATLIVVATATGLILALVRKFATNQDLLRRADADKATLSRLMKEAKKAGDKEAVRRYRTTKSMIALGTFTQEGKPLLLVILPIALLATWAFNRMGYLPPKAGEKVEVSFYAPVSAVGEVMHLVPQAGVTADRWVQPIRMGELRGVKTGVAQWTVAAEAGDHPYRLAFRFRDQTYDRATLLVGQRTYAPPASAEPSGTLGAHVGLREARLLGIVPGLGDFFPPWVVGYLILVIPLAVVLKRVLRVY
jgi:uncharacterized membrane protein (DUF106 family)